MDWATFWAISSQNHLATLLEEQQSCIKNETTLSDGAGEVLRNFTTTSKCRM
jgi:hypothetical protein